MIKEIKWSNVWQTIIVAFIIGCFTWAWTLESRITKIESQNDIKERVVNLENMLTPVLVEYKLRKRLSEMGYNINLSNTSENRILGVSNLISDTSDELLTDNESVRFASETPIYNNISIDKQRELYNLVREEVETDLKK